MSDLSRALHTIALQANRIDELEAALDKIARMDEAPVELFDPCAFARRTLEADDE